MALRNRSQNSSPVKTNECLDNSRRLYYFHELAEWQQDNHYIRSGYVKETSSYRECVKSLTYMHNESVNIYSHLLPSLIVSLVVSKFLGWDIETFDNDLGYWERLNFVQFAFAATFCLVLSALFHLFKCHSYPVCKFGNQCDYFGIVIMITCSLISIILFAFYDIPWWRNFYIILFLALGGICAKVTFDPKFSTSQYRPFRSLMFILFGLSGGLPILTAISIFGVKNASERSCAPWLIAEGFFYIFGAVLYAMRIPERFTHSEENETLLETPIAGKFDLVGHSHQIFHVMVVIAAYCHWKALVGCYYYLHTRTLVE